MGNNTRPGFTSVTALAAATNWTLREMEQLAELGVVCRRKHAGRWVLPTTDAAALLMASDLARLAGQRPSAARVGLWRSACESALRFSPPHEVVALTGRGLVYRAASDSLADLTRAGSVTAIYAPACALKRLQAA